MAGALNTIYTVLAVLVAVVGAVGTLWVTESPRAETRFASGATALAITIFTVALAVTVLG